MLAAVHPPALQALLHLSSSLQALSRRTSTHGYAATREAAMAAFAMANELAHLAHADRHITSTKERIREQKQLIERLIAKGHNVEEAEVFLSALTAILGVFERHRLLILDRLRG